MRTAGGCLIGACLATFLWTGTAPADEVVTVTVEGQGISDDAALKDALRRALEQGGRQEISAHSQVQNYELIRDTIYSRASGLVTDFQILERKTAMGGLCLCRIEAKVSKNVVASTWGEVQNVLEQIGRPGIMVAIDEYIDGVKDDSSILESRIEEMLAKSGFDVYVGKQVQEILRKEGEDAAAENNVAKMQAIAKNFGAQIFITGSAHANQAGVTDAGGAQLAMYNGDCAVKVYYTDTGKLMTTESLPDWRGGVRGQYSFSPQAAKKALANAGQELVGKIYESCMAHWATRISAGDVIELQIEGLRAADAIDVKKRLAEIAGVDSVDFSMSKGIAAYRIKARISASALAEFLVQGEWAKLVEIVDVQPNRLQAKSVVRDK